MKLSDFPQGIRVGGGEKDLRQAFLAPNLMLLAVRSSQLYTQHSARFKAVSWEDTTDTKGKMCHLGACCVQLPGLSYCF